MADERNNVNREYKDRLFKLVFREKEDLLQLYNAVNGTDYNNPEDMEINTLEDAVYMGMKNDISFLFQSVLNLYEHQSAYSPNLPLRGVLYFADLYRKIMAGYGKDLYSSKQIKLPFPQFVIFYNGRKNQPERRVLHLHDAFPEAIPAGMNREGAAIDCHAVLLNINYGLNRQILKKCRKLEEYSAFIGRVREYTDRRMPIREAIDRAVEECIKEGILEKILRENREEVCSMLLSEYDEQAHIESEKEIAREEGMQEGILKGRKEGHKEGENLLARLVDLLQQDGRLQDLKLLSDETERKRLYREYHLADS